MYPGWYDDDKPLDDMDERFALKLRDARNWLVENKQNKPFLVTEFGAAALLGETTFEPGRRWTENYQQKLLEKSIKAIVDSKVVQGFYIWQFCDGRTALPGKVSINRPKCFNNKGIVNEYRKPKLAYYTVRDLLRKISTYR
jgi:beta-glucuronidase